MQMPTGAPTEPNEIEQDPRHEANRALDAIVTEIAASRPEKMPEEAINQLRTGIRDGAGKSELNKNLDVLTSIIGGSEDMDLTRVAKEISDLRQFIRQLP